MPHILDRAAKRDAATLADHVLVNRTSWDADADACVERGRVSWASEEISWGIWAFRRPSSSSCPTSAVSTPVELGCGTGYRKTG